MRWKSLSIGILVFFVLAVSGLYLYQRPRLIKPELTLAYIDVSGAPRKGAVSAPLTLIEFGDYQCEFCSDHARDVEPQLLGDYVATGKVQYVFMNYPLPFHEFAPKAAHAAACAADQGKFWQMHDLLFVTGRITLEQLYEDAGIVGLRLDLFRGCMERGLYNKQIAAEHAQGLRAQVSGTPTFFIGRASDRIVTVTTKFAGAVSYRSLRSAIEDLLKQLRTQERVSLSF